MKIIEMNIEDLIPYEDNPRINYMAVDAVARSIREFGFKVPIIVDKNNVMVLKFRLSWIRIMLLLRGIRG